MVQYSGTTTFNLDVDEIITEAFSRLGGEDISGAETRQARVKLNLILLDLNNYGINLWTVERVVLPLSYGTYRYVLGADTLDIPPTGMVSQQPANQNRLVSALTDPFTVTTGSASVLVTQTDHGAQVGDTVVLSNQVTGGGITLTTSPYTVVTVPDNDSYTITGPNVATSPATFGGSITITYPGVTELMMSRISRDEYFGLPNKYVPGQPTQFYLDRQIIPVLYLYMNPVAPWNAVAFKRQRRIYDVSSMTDNVEVPVFILPSVIAGLAWRMSQMRPQIAPELRADLKAQYEESLQTALAEDRDASPLEMQPDFSSYYRP